MRPEIGTDSTSHPLRSVRRATAAPPTAAVLARDLEQLLGTDAVQPCSAARPAPADPTLLNGRGDVLVLPRTTAEVAEVLRYADDARVAVVPRGGLDASPALGAQGGIVLGCSRMDRLLELDTEDRIAVAQSGLPVSRLTAAAGDHGLRHVADPGPCATLGGTVATAAAGLHGRKHGTVREQLLGLEVVLPGGETIRTGGRVVGDGAGYDLTRLLCGSEGTLGVITEVTLQLAPAPPATAIAAASFATPHAAARAVAAILRAPFVPATLELLDRTCVDAVERLLALGVELDPDAGALLLFGQDGDPDAIARELAAMTAACRAAGARAVTVAGCDDEAERLLDARRVTPHALASLGSETMHEDLTVPPSAVGDLLARIEEVASRYALQIAVYGNVGAGRLHPTCILDPGDEPAAERARSAFAEIFEVALDLGGVVIRERGVGHAKLAFLERQLGPEQVALLWRIKNAFDPHGILSPGKLGS